MTVRRLLGCALLLTLVSPLLLAAVRGDKAEYVGGTVKTIKQNTQGILNLDDKKELIFAYGKRETFAVPYEKITSMEFGQKHGQRVGSTNPWGVSAPGIGPLLMLFAKKKHFLTIAITNQQGANEVMILEVSKDIVRTTIPVLEARTGQKVRLEESTAKKGKDKR